MTYDQEVDVHLLKYTMVREANKTRIQINSYYPLLHCQVVDSTQEEVALLELVQQLGRGRDDVHIAALASKAVNNNVVPLPEKSFCEECLGGNSRSLSKFAIDSIVWFKSIGKISSS